jgi:glycosyltransferase involved in cell wall biosynthesis
MGRRISKALDLPLVADFRDPWTLTSVNLRKRSGFSEGIDQEIEKSIISDASKLIFTSKLTEEKYRERYYLPESKTSTIYNSFDRTLMKEYEEDGWDVKLKPNYLNLIFMGRFRRLSPATPIIFALNELKEENLPLLRCVRIHSFGQPDIEEREMIRDSGLEENFIFHERVVPENVNSVLKSADILLLSTNQERNEVIPAKLWDYLSVEIPILSIAPNPEVGEIIMRSKSGIQIKPEQTHELAEILKSFAHAKKNGESLLLSPEKEIPDRNIYEAKQKTGELAALFDDLLSNV